MCYTKNFLIYYWKYMPAFVTPMQSFILTYNYHKPITIIQVYGPTTDDDEEVESFYVHDQEEMDHVPKHDVLIIIGAWDTELGNKAGSYTLGSYGRGAQNEAVQT